MEQGSEDAGDEVNTGARVTDLRAGHERHAVDLARRRRRAAGALRHVLVDLAVLERAGPETLHRGVDHPRIALLDQLREDLLAGLGFRVERDAALVRVQHREVEAVDAGLVAKLAAGGVAFTGALD